MASTASDTDSNKPLVVVIAGVTGSGKSAVAAELCASSHYRGIIVSADSVQAYAGVQIGANKPDAAERERTPHILLDVADHTVQNYNAAAWRRDALYVIRQLLGQTSPQNAGAVEKGVGGDDDLPLAEQERRRQISATVEDAKRAKLSGDGKDNIRESSSFLPVVVGGTMMYLQWLVHGRPDAARPTREAQRLSDERLAAFKSNDDWDGAVRHVVAHGDAFAAKVQDLAGQDWYRLGRLLEVALTVKDDPRAAEQLYSGLREGSLSSMRYDVRCFFLCPDNRMQHTKVMDRRCEEMIVRGLLRETTDLTVKGEMPDMAAKAIGYRQTLDYLQRENPIDGDQDAFQVYLEEFATATRQYGKRQMQWFRRDDEFVFVPVSSTLNHVDRVRAATDEMMRLINMPRNDYDRERVSPESLSSKTRANNEAQGKGMKFYHFETQLLHPESQERRDAIAEADACVHALLQQQAA